MQKINFPPTLLHEAEVKENMEVPERQASWKKTEYDGTTCKLYFQIKCSVEIESMFTIAEKEQV